MVVRLVVRAVVFRVNIPVVVRLVVPAPAVVFRVHTLAVGVRALGRRGVTRGVMRGVRPVRLGAVVFRVNTQGRRGVRPVGHRSGGGDGLPT